MPDRKPRTEDAGTAAGEAVLGELRELRAQVRDIAVLLALPAMWRGRETPYIAGNLLDVLMRMLRLDFTYVRLDGDDAFEAWQPESAARPQDLLDELHSQLQGGDTIVTTKAIQARGRRRLKVAALWPGILGRVGLVVVGSHRTDFPTQAERFLLTVAVEQAAIAIDTSRILRREQQSRAEAEAAVRARDEFLSIAAHELRNPVAGIKGAVQALQRSLDRGQIDLDRIARYLNSLSHTSERLAVLVVDLLDVSRLQAGQLKLRRSDVDLARQVREFAATYKAIPKNHRLRVSCPDACMACIDPDRIQQILTNLLDNAIKYSPDGGDVWITLVRDGDGIVLSVKDQGIGLSAGASEHIFEPFGRALNATQRNLPGLGLGLHICRRVAEAHGGRMWAKSDGEGRGTTVYLWLPSGGSPAASPQAAASAPSDR